MGVISGQVIHNLQDLDKQHHLLLDYAQKQMMRIAEFIEVEIFVSKECQRETH
jgi:hypothetical protein